MIRCVLLLHIFGLYSSISQQTLRPSLIEVHPDREIFFDNTTIEIPCKASANSDPVYSWLKDGLPLFLNSSIGEIRNGSLSLWRLGEEVEGVYQCMASNEYGKAVSTKTRLIKAAHSMFDHSNTRTIRPLIGAYYKLECNPPRSRPAARVFWAIINRDEEIAPIQEIDRHQIDDKGNLHFVNVDKDDGMGDSAYACISQNSQRRSIVMGVRTLIEPIMRPDDLMDHRPSLVWNSPLNEVALKGGEKILKCIFAGNPTPWVTWERIHLVSGRFERRFINEFVINEVDFSDAGAYECAGENALGYVKSPAFQLTVESLPEWKGGKHPESVEVSEGGEAIFSCQAEGVPSPRVEWSINGEVLTEHDGEKMEWNDELGVLKFINVSKDDAMVIQCNASNKHGYIFANVYLYVL